MFLTEKIIDEYGQLYAWGKESPIGYDQEYITKAPFIYPNYEIGEEGAPI